MNNINPCKKAFEIFINQHWYSVNALKLSRFSNRTYDSTDIENMWRGFIAAWDKNQQIRRALEETTEVLECLRRGHRTEVGAACFPALNNTRSALET